MSHDNRMLSTGGVTDDMIIDPGWADIYVADIPCQWIDVTSVPDGSYKLRVTVDASNIVDEDDVLPNTAEILVRIAGNQMDVMP